MRKKERKSGSPIVGLPLQSVEKAQHLLDFFDRLSTPGEAGGTFFEISYCKNAKMWYHTCERRTLLDGGGSRR